MRKEVQAIRDVLYPYTYSKKWRWRLLPASKAKLLKAYPQHGGDHVLEIRIHESKLVKAREAFNTLLSQTEGQRPSIPDSDSKKSCGFWRGHDWDQWQEERVPAICCDLWSSSRFPVTVHRQKRRCISCGKVQIERIKL